MSSEDAPAGELRALFHQIEDGVFSLAADNGKAAYINNQSAPFQVTASVLPRRAELVYPRLDQPSFHKQLALRPVIDDGNLEHVDSRDGWVSATQWPKGAPAKWLKALVETKPPRLGVEKCRNRYRHLSRREGIRAEVET